MLAGALGFLLILQGFYPLGPGPVEVEQTLRIRGIIIDARSGKPVAGAEVAIAEHPGQYFARSDAAGRYTIEAPYRTAAGSSGVRVIRTGFLPELRRAQLDCAMQILEDPGYCDKQLNIELRSSDRLFQPSAPVCSAPGLVLGEEGTPVPGAQVILEGTQSGVLTDSAGRFEIENVPAGLHLATAQSIGFLADQKIFLVACSGDRPTEPVTFRLQTHVIR